MTISKERLREILEMVELCPENLREKCFELLLASALSQRSDRPGREQVVVKDDEKEKDASNVDDSKIGSGDEIMSRDLHTKAKKMIPKDISLQEINNLFYKENGGLLPLFDDLKSDKVAESQIRVALMEAFKNGLMSGNFEFNTQTVREQCENYKCYDLANFAGNFKKNQNYFNEEYIKNGVMSLSSTGKQKMIQVAKELAV